MREILLAEDDPVFRRVLARSLEGRGYSVRAAASVDEALTWLIPPSAVGAGPAADRVTASQAAPTAQAVPTGIAGAIVDLRLDGRSGLQLVVEIRARLPACRILMLTGYASIATAIDAIKLGADGYLAKPADTDAIVRALFEEHQPDAAALPDDDVMSVSRLEWEHIQRVLTEHQGNVSAAARTLKMHRRTLQRKLSKYAPKS